MSDNINWKERYIELEQQLENMMNMTLDLVEKSEKFKDKAEINQLSYTQIDEKIEVVAITKGKNPIYTFEIIDDKTRDVIMQKSESRKNTCQFNIGNLSDFRVKVHIKNEDDKEYSHSRISKLLNKWETMRG